MPYVVFLDTCVLVPSFQRDLILELAAQRLFGVRWSDVVESELSRVLRALKARQGLDEESIDSYVRRLLAHMNAAFPDARVELDPSGIRHWSERLTDPDDGHIVAGGVLAGAHAIITRNLKDFPEGAVPRQLTVTSPDDFLVDQFRLSPQLLVAALQTVSDRTGRKGRKYSPEEIVALLALDLPNFAAEFESVRP